MGGNVWGLFTLSVIFNKKFYSALKIMIQQESEISELVQNLTFGRILNLSMSFWKVLGDNQSSSYRGKRAK